MARRLNPRKLLLSKWTASVPVNREKHFLVVKLIDPELPDGPIQQLEVDAVYSHRRFIMPWRELCDESVWLQGWR